MKLIFQTVYTVSVTSYCTITMFEGFERKETTTFSLVFLKSSFPHVFIPLTWAFHCDNCTHYIVLKKLFQRNTQFVANEDEDADSMDEDFEDEEDDDSDQSPSRPQPQQGGFFSDRVDSHKREENGATVEVVKIVRFY